MSLQSFFSSKCPEATLLMQVDPRGKTWNRLRSSIGMPNFTADTQIEVEKDQLQLQAEAESHHAVKL